MPLLYTQSSFRANFGQEQPSLYADSVAREAEATATVEGGSMGSSCTQKVVRLLTGDKDSKGIARVALFYPKSTLCFAVPPTIVAPERVKYTRRAALYHYTPEDLKLRAALSQGDSAAKRSHDSTS